MTMDDIVFGIKRSFDRDTFPEGADLLQRLLARRRQVQGPYTDKGKPYNGVTVDGQNLTIKMAKPFPTCPTGVRSRRSARSPTTTRRPGRLRAAPDVHGPYMIEEYTPNQSLHLVRNENWDPETDPGRHAYVDEYKMEFGIGNQSIVDTRILSDNERRPPR
jgi:peptide/nickel transport system substrate-binding protein